MSLGNWLWPSSLRQLFGAASTSLNTIASAVLFERQPFERIVRCRTVAKVLSIGFEVLRCFQCSAGKIVECEQGLAILRQALGGLMVFQLVGCGEGVERGLGVLARLGHPDLL